MSKTNLTILDSVAYAEYLAEQNREASAELKAVLKAQPIITTPSVSPYSRATSSWFSFAVVAIVAASFGLFAGVALALELS